MPEHIPNSASQRKVSAINKEVETGRGTNHHPVAVA
jgi:hypothetical protein